MSWVQLTGYQGCKILVNLAQVSCIYPICNPNTAYRTELFVPGADQPICVEDSIEEIKALLPRAVVCSDVRLLGTGGG